MTMSPELTALRDEAMQTSCRSWAIQKRWKLTGTTELVGPCPQCGGKDRFAINVRENVFLCRRCDIKGSGVIDLVMQTEGVTFVVACERITGRKAADPVAETRMAELRTQAEAAERERERQANMYRERAIADGRAILRRTVPVAPGGIVGAYLALVRGLDGGRIDFRAPDWAAQLHIRWIPEHPYWDDGKVLHSGPAMICGVQQPDGKFIGAHQTWIDLEQPKGKLVLLPDDKGRPRSAKKVRGSWKGGAIRLFTPEAPHRIVMGEGIETTLTAYAHAFEPDTAYWAGVALGNMADFFVPPDCCQELVYLTDEAESLPKLAKGFARIREARPALECFATPPLAGGRDLNSLVAAQA